MTGVVDPTVGAVPMVPVGDNGAVINVGDASLSRSEVDVASVGEVSIEVVIVGEMTLRSVASVVVGRAGATSEVVRTGSSLTSEVGKVVIGTRGAPSFGENTGSIGGKGRLPFSLRTIAVRNCKRL